MMIYGVAYHVIPRFTGHELHRRGLAALQWWLANAGLALMVTGFCLAPHAVPAAPFVLGTGGVLSASAAYCFGYNIWRTIDGARRQAGVPTPVGIGGRKTTTVAGKV
jgi:cbb3-type cytochrome oxidase subunit 1